MPVRGYRKGRSDQKFPLTRFVRTRLSDHEFSLLVAEAESRSVGIAGLTRSVLAAHLSGHRAELSPSARHDERRAPAIGARRQQPQPACAKLAAPREHFAAGSGRPHAVDTAFCQSLRHQNSPGQRSRGEAWGKQARENQRELVQHADGLCRN